MKIGVAQTRSFKGNLEKGIARHIELVERAAVLGADALFFPELSLTGYEPAMAQELATKLDDSRFDCFQLLSDRHKMTLGTGMPLIADKGVQISMLVFQPAQARQYYSKQYLHADELPYFVQGDSQLFIVIEDQWIAPAICYESLLEAHMLQCSKVNTTIYLASVAKNAKGLAKTQIHFPKIAKRHNITVLMANAVGFCDCFDAMGNSGVWDCDGQRLSNLNDRDEGILLFDTTTKKSIRESMA